MADISRLVLEVDSNGVVKAVGNLKAFTEQAKKAETQTNSLDRFFQNFNASALASAAGVASAVKALSSLGDAVKSAIDVYSQFEQMESGLAGVLQSAEKGKELFEDLRGFSLETTFGVDTLASAAQQLLTVGTSMNDLKTRISQLGNAAGGSTEKFSRLVDVFTKIQATGKASQDQIQTLSSVTGVSWVKVLEEMGVAGSASAQDIQDALQNLTSEGEVFYGTMERINETIEGKTGFVTDTFRELQASFAEASGAADLYKTALDFAYNALQGLVNAMQAANANPVYKAILQGALAAGVTALVTAIGVALVGAVKKLNAQLAITATLKSVINPTGLAIAAIAAGITGAAVAAVSLAKNVKDVKDEMDSAADSAADLQKALSGEGMDDWISDIRSAMSAEVEAYQSALTASEANAAKIRERYKNITAEVSAFMSGTDLLFGELAEFAPSLYAEWKEAGAQFKAISAAIYGTDGVKQAIKDSTSALAEFDDEVSKMASEQKLKDALLSDAETLIKNSQSLQDELNSVTEKIASLQERANKGFYTGTPYIDEATGEKKISFAFEISDEEKAKIKKEIEILKGEEEELRFKIVLEGLSDAQKALQEAFDFEKKDILGGALNTGVGAVSKWVSKQTSALDSQLELYDKLGLGTNEQKSSLVSKTLNDFQSALATLAGSDKFSAKTLQPLADEITSLEERLESLKGVEESVEDSFDVKKFVSNTLSEMANTIDIYEELGLDSAEIRFDEMSQAANTLRGKLSELAATGKYAAEELEPLGTAVRELEEKIEELSSVDEQEAPTVSNGTQDFSSAVQGGLQEFFDALAHGVSASDSLSSALSGASASSVGFGMALQAVIELFSALTTRVTEFADEMENSAYTTDFFDTLAEKLLTDDFMDSSLTDIGNVNEGLVNLADGLGEIIDLVQPLVDTMSNFSTSFEIFGSLFTIIGGLLKVIAKLGSCLQPVAQLLAKIVTLNFVLEWFSDALEAVASLFGFEEEKASEEEEELERLKELNEQYKSLKEAIEEQEEYYLQKRREVNANTYSDALASTSYGVNDMILTPQGNFSTDPDDYIIATKNPSELGSGGATVVLSVNISNSASDLVSVTAAQNTDESGNDSLDIQIISRQVAGDFASGSNGWDAAYSARETRRNGRSITT